jgi:hypothetical protein
MNTGRDELLEALRDLLAWAECAEAKLDGELGLCRSIEEIERDGDLPEEISAARAAIKKCEGV